MKMKKLLVVPVALTSAFLGAATARVQSACAPFADVPAGLCPFVLEMYYLGITAGTSATTFSPDLPVTRGQAAVFVAKGIDTAIQRSSRRAALGQWWTTTPHYAQGLGVIAVGGQPGPVVSDGADVWVVNSNDGTVSRIQGS